VSFYCEAQLKAAGRAQALTEASHFFLDSTGSIIKPHGRKTIYIYSLCSFVPIESVKAIPILEWLSDTHDTATISKVMEKWKPHATLHIQPPQIITTDFSFALMAAAVQTFTKNSLSDQLQAQWVLMTHETVQNIPLTILRLCDNHFIHMISRRLKMECVSKKVNDLIYLKNCNLND